MIEFDRVSMHYGSKRVLERFSYSFEAGQHYAVLGPSGCGKTTLVRLAAGLETPTSGLIRRMRDHHAAVCFQEDRLLPGYTALQNITVAARCSNTAARRWLSLAGLEREENTRPAALSGGMKRRLALVRALALDAPILLLDEPFRALDDTMHKEMLSLVREQAKNRLLLLVTHDESDAQDMTILRLTPSHTK